MSVRNWNWSGRAAAGNDSKKRKSKKHLPLIAKKLRDERAQLACATYCCLPESFWEAMDPAMPSLSASLTLAQRRRAWSCLFSET
jgi:hypothetical protein